MPRPNLLLALTAAACILAGCENKITQESYDKIADGMTQSQVEKLLGGKGDEQDIGGVSIGADGLMSGAKGTGKDKTFVWKKDGSEISVTFRDGKMIAKGKSGI